MYFKEQIEKLVDEPEIKNILLEQKARYDFLNSKTLNDNLKDYIKDGEFVFPPDGLIHGTQFDLSKMQSIKKDGILASEFSIMKSDAYNETYYMADFFKNVTGRDISIQQLLTCFKGEHAIRYLPDTNLSNESKIAFVVNTKKLIVKNYLELDLFSNKPNNLYYFIDEEMFYSLSRRKRLYHCDYLLGQSSIPIGVPYNALCAVIVDKSIEDSKATKLKSIVEIFGEDLLIVSSNGKVLSSPKANKNLYDFEEKIL